MLRRSLCVFFLTIIAAGCQAPEHEAAAPSVESYVQALSELQSRYRIPGISVHVRRAGVEILSRGLGLADADTGRPVTPATQFPVASITKLYSATLLLKAVDAGRLSLDTPIAEIIPDSPLEDSITVGQVLSHTSQGAVPGEHFYYSIRFSLLTRVIEAIYDAPFAEVLNDELLVPLKLDDSYLLPASAVDMEQARLERLASPYQYEGELTAGSVDYGASASAGLVATAAAVSDFTNALFTEEILSARALRKLTEPPGPGLPYGHGIFVDELYGKSVYWAYGQYESYSSLLLIVPEAALTLVMTANNAHLADPARLIYGNLRNCEFALLFLEHFASIETDRPELQRDRLKAGALGDSFLGRYHAEQAASSEARLAELFQEYPEYDAYGDLALLHNLSMLKSIAHHARGESFTRFDTQYRRIAEAILADDPDNPYARTYLAGMLDLNGLPEEARVHYQNIVDAPNFSPWWYTRLAEQWLADSPE